MIQKLVHVPFQKFMKRFNYHFLGFYQTFLYAIEVCERDVETMTETFTRPSDSVGARLTWTGSTSGDQGSSQAVGIFILAVSAPPNATYPNMLWWKWRRNDDWNFHQAL